MGRLMALFAARLEPGHPVADTMFHWPRDASARGDNVPLRIAGGLHALFRTGHPELASIYPPATPSDDALWAAVSATLDTDAGFLLDRLTVPPQTNEVRRSAALIPVLHLLSARFGLPINMIEIGASAGLNIQADRFRLSAGATDYGPSNSSVHLTPDWTGPAPAIASPEVVGRLGVDVNPLDTKTGAERLLSFLWPDQPDRIARTEAALDLVRSNPAQIVRSDAIDWPKQWDGPQAGQVTLLFHTIAWQYLPPEARARGEVLIAEQGARVGQDAPFARFAMEAAGPHAALSLQLWPGRVMFDLGRIDYHGRWVEWNKADLPEGTVQ